ncbi:protein of unknown function (plasmid) [Cupriavidus taiwanensis]|uniref:Uncharacterized protein n=1 Tax=Cupriavidus taiwanensis TaxID=164546 RepID=A0A375EDF1_9BURK|nr:hypothetical protein [Cupriavidus taiwanensis]SOZ71364.1 protein of unknown function [Cupriavidus taiwanensis]SOZ72420.1 protein of unknown function [Cupriavidus taiwanensis]SOZ74798.1 protein of unknown function [Cupriavidus taiwanensis]SPA03622.1 protein of unknown function [Cupriavidus taiwanensis]SPA11522.1 protein of unknown function [Cupriavidus taiwanensis]
MRRKKVPAPCGFPYDTYEGIKIHDWDKWKDPFRPTMDAYWKYQVRRVHARAEFLQRACVQRWNDKWFWRG